MKSYEQQCAERLEDINRTLKELTKAIRDISFSTKLAREDLAEMKRILKEAKESDPENFIYTPAEFEVYDTDPSESLKETKGNGNDIIIAIDDDEGNTIREMPWANGKTNCYVTDPKLLGKDAIHD